MMRSAREQPRLVVAKTLGMLCLVVCGLALGLLLSRGDDEASRTAQLQLVSVERASKDQANLLRETRAQLADAQAARVRSEAARARLRVQLRASARATARLRRDLRIVRRALLRERKQN